ncbi:hypothetical protein B0A49_02407 [Cryomyces minteri]|uniref:N-alpha-acetyltransferase 16, NatA auxiliary subunit n=1 Tax=Cryomyces minteri TaxID=331657 RepID=A0A4V5NIX2_9PEZI|nr:hypothetical protein B0A49_02407 [Cryomyces minteri]
MPQPLSSKDNSLFRQVVKCYESKQYKKGLKAAEQVLRKNPNHGDTQAMKALILNSQGHTEEAFALAKTALKNDMKSHVCWHVYGLLYRSVKNFEEAIKAYKFALRLEPESASIQRDLAHLQIQMRDYQGYIQSRKAMLQARPQLRQNWTAMAIAHHLAGDLAAAESVLNTYEETLKSAPPKSDTEHSEAVLYKNTIIAEMGETQRALEHLETIIKNNLDRAAVLELRAQYLLQLDRKEDAEKAYRVLVERNNEYRPYYQGLERSLSLNRTDAASLKPLAELYGSFAEKNERLDAARRIPLDFLQGDRFREAADSYLRRMLNKGVPSTFANVKALYEDEEKRRTIGELVEGYASDKQMNGSAEKQTNGDTADQFQLSVLYFLAQHYNFHLSRNLQKATESVDKAVELKASSVPYDYYMTKARTWKHYGNTQKASEVMNKAREIDEKDRYINTKCAKYQLRNNQNEDALKTMSKFTRNEVVGGTLGDLHDMQCMWYITEDGEAYLRQGKLGLALKRFKAIYDIFDVWYEDQFDFHSFSLRKGQIRAYVDMVRWEDHLREHPFFVRAAISAVKIYVRLYDKPDLAHGANGVDGGMDANERRKVLKKAKKEQERLEKAEAEKRDAEKKAANKKTATGADGEPKKEDEDPQGIKLVQTKEPLEDAMKFLSPLLEFSPKNVEAQNVGFEVFIRREKYLLALKCLLAASSVEPSNPTLHEQTIRFRRTLDARPTPLPPKVSEVINSTFTLLPASTSLIAHNDAYLSKHAHSASAVQAGLRVRKLLDAATQPQNEKDLIATLELSGATLEEAKAGLALLGDWSSAQEVKKAYLEAAGKRWPEATAFKAA